jgi:SAM-dependent methyltransferase
MSLGYWTRRPKKLLWAARTAADRVYESTLAGSLPRLHAWRLRRRRGEGIDESAAAAYARAVADDYEILAREAGVLGAGDSLWRGKRVLELGPGDVLSVGLVALLRGAASYHAVDAFDIASRAAERNAGVYRRVAALEGAPEAEGPTRVAGAKIERDLSSARARGLQFDVVISRAVLEHVADLEALFADLSRVVSDDALLLHKVDLRSHGMEQDSELDFLLFPERVYRRMAAHLDLPNRVRAGAYLELAERHRMRTLLLQSSHRARPDSLERVRGQLPSRFARLSDGELAVLGLWLVQGGPARSPAVTVPGAADEIAAATAAFSRY